jgi:hypothetical protein
MDKILTLLYNAEMTLRQEYVENQEKFKKDVCNLLILKMPVLLHG